MSQDQPKPPPETEPQTPEPKLTPSQFGSALQQVNQTLQQAWSRAQPVLRSQSIRALKATIQLLEAVLAKLEATPPKGTSTHGPLESSEPTATGTAPESQAISLGTSEPTPEKLPERSMPVASLESFLTQLRPRLDQLQRWWSIALSKIRSWLPESVNQKFSDTTLTGAIAGILIILLWTTSALLPGKPSPKMATTPTPQRNLPVPDLIAPPELSAPEKSQPVNISPPPPAPVVTPPPIVLSPEEQRIADIQTQVTEVGNRYADCLIQSVQTNVQAGRLTAKTSNNWYNLGSPQQDMLANELLNQAQKLTFRKLEIVDAQGRLLARSPVVGDSMVVLQRQIASPKLTPS